MPTKLRRIEAPAEVASFSVGVLEAPELNLASYLKFLSEREIQRLDRISSPKRRKKWIRGRLLLKYLFLDQMEEYCPEEETSWPPKFIRISEGELDRFSPWVFKNLEVLTSKNPEGGYPRMCWYGKSTQFNVSITHSATHSCGVIGRTGVVGIDMEYISPKVPEFYQQNFSVLERNWVREMVASGEIPGNWLYLLLWTLKEAVLKSRKRHEVSVWEFPNLEIMLSTQKQKILDIYHSKAFLGALSTFPVNIRSDADQLSGEVALTGNKQLILSVLKI